MAPYNRPQSQAFGFRQGSLQRDPSKKTLKAAEEVTSITGMKTMSALGPSMHKTEFSYRRTSYSHAEELIKKRNINSRQMKRVILTSSNAPQAIKEEHEEFVVRQSMINQQINSEEEMRRFQNLASSPTRMDQDGVVTIVGKQEYDDEVLRSHYLMHMMRSKDQ